MMTHPIHLALAATAPLLFGITLAAEDQSDFTTEPAAGWQRVDALGLASFSFDGGSATLACPAPPIQIAQTFGLARCALLAPTEYTTAAVSVDVVSTGSTRTFASVITRVGTPAGLGVSRGYSLTIIPSESGKFQLHRLDGEIPTLIAPTTYAALQPGRNYRLLLVSAGSTHTGRIYDAADLTTPLAELTATDGTYTSGRSGIVASTDSLVPIAATFDNFLAWDGTPAPLAITPSTALPGAVQLRTDARRAIATRVESAPDLTLGPWDFIEADLQFQTGPTLDTHHLPAGPRRFFRRRLLGTR